MYSNTLAVMRQNLSMAMGDLILSAPSSFSSTTFVDTMLRQANDYYNDHRYRGYCYSGTAIGQEREVSDWVLTGNTVTFDPAFSPAPATGNLFELHRIFTQDEYRKAINMAIEYLADRYLIDKIDATTVLVASTYEYSLPDAFYFIHRITTEKDAGGSIFDERDVLDMRDWRLISSRKLKLHEDRYSITAGKDLRLEGQGRQALVTADTSIIYLPPDWIIQKAITFLPHNKIQSNMLENTFRQAVLLSANEPHNYPHPQAKKVVE